MELTLIDYFMKMKVNIVIALILLAGIRVITVDMKTNILIHHGGKYHSNEYK